MIPSPADYEHLGAFYLGRTLDPETSAPTGPPLLYDSRDLTTHAFCVGMTGSGKTGLCVSLLEEAAIDGVPAICIDPKGDLGNLLLTFPSLAPDDFEPWIDVAEAARRGQSVAERARDVAKQWREGLAQWGQDGARIARLRDAAELALYTPGSSAGRPLAVIRSLDAPKSADAESLREAVDAAVSSLLALLGVDADPIQSREHVFLANLLHHAWSGGRSLDLGGLVRAVLEPPFARVGVLDLESFFPAKDRQALAMRLNAVLANPGFAAWLEGEPLDVQRLLYTPEGKPRVSILSIAHLSDVERMFFLTRLLGEVLAETKLYSRPGEGYDELVARVRQDARERRDREVGRLRERWTQRLERGRGEVRRAEERVARERGQARSAQLDAALGVGTTVLGAVFGGGTARGHASRAATTARKAGRVSQRGSTLARAEAQLAEAREKLAALEAEMSDELEAQRAADVVPAIEAIAVPPRKGDLRVTRFALAWVPVAP
ncbi:MAG: hypothetical protein KF901_01465 [Myxococcales bacterium]|nr:hypothetical protein [Myxococcales bacterium]